jgi:hypothetical protein
LTPPPRIDVKTHVRYILLISSTSSFQRYYLHAYTCKIAGCAGDFTVFINFTTRRVHLEPSPSAKNLHNSCKSPPIEKQLTPFESPSSALQYTLFTEDSAENRVRSACFPSAPLQNTGHTWYSGSPRGSTFNDILIASEAEKPGPRILNFLANFNGN